MEIFSTVIKVVVTFVLALIFGIERQRTFKPAGFGIYVFVAMAACGLSIVSLERAGEGAVSILAAVVTATGFLGAGALIKTANKVFGFTTAASIWFFACFGVVMALGEYVVAGTLYALVLSSLALDRFLDRKGIGTQEKVTIYTSEIVDQSEVEGEISACAKNFRFEGIEEDKESGRMALTYTVFGRKDCIPALASRLRSKKWFNALKGE
ncbi:MAG: MgtC/SapB family protein [Candidatus Methanosuratincola sp.]